MVRVSDCKKPNNKICIYLFIYTFCGVGSSCLENFALFIYLFFLGGGGPMPFMPYYCPKMPFITQIVSYFTQPSSVCLLTLRPFFSNEMFKNGLFNYQASKVANSYMFSKTKYSCRTVSCDVMHHRLGLILTLVAGCRTTQIFIAHVNRL
jgi:hypothetical protein